MLNAQKEAYEESLHYSTIEQIEDNKELVNELLKKMGGNSFKTTKKTMEKLKEKQKEFEDLKMNVSEFESRMESLTEQVTLNKTDPITIVDNDHVYTIGGKFSSYNSDYKSSRKLFCIDVKAKYNLKDYLNTYVTALALIADCDDGDYSVRLFIVNPEPRIQTVSNKEMFKPFSITPSDSRKQLLQIIKNAYSCKKKKFLPVEMLDKSPSFEELVDYVSGDNGPWQYSPATKLLNVQTDLGYSQDSIYSSWEEEVRTKKELLKYLEKIEDRN